MRMATFISHSPAETEALGEKFGRAAERGLVIALSGDLGAGKTQFVRGVARGLETPGRVHSPTFTLVNEYGGGRMKLFHLDLYRLETPQQVLSAGVEEYLKPDGVSVIEWAERIWGLESGVWGLGKHPTPSLQHPTSKFRTVRIEITNETERKIVFDDFL